VPILGVERFDRMYRGGRTLPDRIDRLAGADPVVNAANAAQFAILSGEASVKPSVEQPRPDTADFIAFAADYAVKAVAANASEPAAQAGLLREVFGPLPFRKFRIDPCLLAENGGLVVKLAQAAYEHGLLPGGELDPARLAVLGDALEDAGCTDALLLGHLRSEGPHVRGCFALDIVLGKN
jgi:hypothetical protein